MLPFFKKIFAKYNKQTVKIKNPHGFMSYRYLSNEKNP